MRIVSGVVLAEKLINVRTKFGWSFRVDIRVIVFPDPGGPQRIKGFWLSSQWPSIVWCQIVSTVSITLEAF